MGYFLMLVEKQELLQSLMITRVCTFHTYCNALKKILGATKSGLMRRGLMRGLMRVLCGCCAGLMRTIRTLAN